MLSPYRAVSLLDHRGDIAAAMLAALGMEVIVVEPPGGAAHRGTAAFEAYSRGTRSLILDPQDRDTLRRLVAGADVLLDNGGPLTAEEAARLNPALVHCSVSGFGAAGPKAAWPVADLTIAASACWMAQTGDADRAPVVVSAPQSWRHAGSEAAWASVLGLVERARSGRGQHLDVSAQASVLQAAFPGPLYAANGSRSLGRIAGGILAPNGTKLQFVYPAKDGFVSITLLFGDTIGVFTQRLMNWVHEAGHCSEAVRDKDWIDYFTLILTGVEPPEEFEAVKAAIAALTSSLTKAELFAEARRRQLLLAPVYTLADLAADEHLSARAFWDRPGGAVVPGPYVWPSATPLRRGLAAPAPGEFGAEFATEPDRRPTTQPATVATPGPALDGLKVLDFSWVFAGPLVTRALADFGATVVKVEGPRKPDASRGGAPPLNQDYSPESSGQYAHLNAGKLGITLDLERAEGRAVIEDLVRWADVVVESFTPGTMAAWGLDYPRLAQLNPNLVMLSTSLMGQTGPLSSFAGFGNLAGALSGFYELTGWPDRSPAGPFLAYTDYMSPRFMLASLLGALDHRRRTGQGQNLDFSQIEAAIWFLAPELLEWSRTGVMATRTGNRSAVDGPHGVFATADVAALAATGDDDAAGYVALACESDAQWRALAGVLGDPGLADRYPTATTRVAAAAEIEALVSGWAAGLDAAAAETALLAAGVPAHRVQNSAGALADPQLVARDHWRTVPHPVHGSCVVEAPRVRASRTPGRVERAGPTLGEHADRVLRDLLGYDDEAVTELIVAGALG
jgi:crotonobetainyl-CoA:carnitine CoA-transferase CaiB-like acyl-CoA transferase